MRSIKNWFDTTTTDISLGKDAPEQIDWLRIIPFIGIHLVCLSVFIVGVSWFALVFALAMYLLRMFAITAFYHRYFSHKSFKTSRPVQFLFGLIGATATQRGPLWWASHHRYHHRHSDTEKDNHSPRKGFIWSHMGWFLSKKHFYADHKLVPDLARYPELVWLDRFDIAVPILFGTVIFFFGWALEVLAPSLNTGAWQLLVWGYFVSTVVLIHMTLTINSFAHRFGKRRYNTKDDSRNNGLLALFTLGEGWHNNHHHYAASARQGFFWWEIDISYYLIRLMKTFRLVWDIKPVPDKHKYNFETTKALGSA